MDFKKHLETSWNLTLKYIAPLIFMTLLMLIVSFFTLGILFPVTMAGYIYSILLMIREGREPKIQDIFSHMRLFFPLLGFTLLVVIVVLIGFMLLLLPCIFFMLAVSFCCIYMIPIMVDQNLGLVDSIKKSYALAFHGEVVDHIVIVLLFIGITAIGNSIFIGTLLTQPFATIFLLSVYQEKLTALDSSEKPKIESTKAT
ncbi:MAG: hypothetical protein JRI53_09145 [Deltaproteobacteria bacterium]|nr:hypothetical protein [Deltaproteobacteria bacterium]